MRRSRFTEAQIIGRIKEQEAGIPAAEVSRRHGLSAAIFDKLKFLPADTMLDNVVLKDLLGKNWRH